MQGKNKETEDKPTFQVVDRRHFTDPDAIPAGVAADEKPRYPTFVEELLARVSETERRFEEKKAQMQQEISRAKARLEADLERRLELEKQKLVLPFLEVLDNLERAAVAAETVGNSGSLLEGIRMIAGLLRGKLQSLGVVPIEVLRRPFDPNEGQAIATVGVSSPELDGVVVDELQRGYRMGDQILRPAQVRVGQYRPE